MECSFVLYHPLRFLNTIFMLFFCFILFSCSCVYYLHVILVVSNHSASGDSNTTTTEARKCCQSA